MGTRNLTCAVIDGEYKIANYAQWDGYPAGVGITILEFLRDKMDRPLLEEKLKKLSFYTKDELNTLDEQIQNKTIEYPKYLSRDVGGDILEFVQNGVWKTYDYDSMYTRKEVLHECNIEKLVDQLDFAGDSLFCEYAYVVDFDKNTFEVYKGFVKYPHTGERFSDFEYEKSHRDNQYYPVKLWKTFDLNDLPTNDKFLGELNENEEDED